MTIMRLEVRLDDALAEDLLSDRAVRLLHECARALADDLGSALIGVGQVTVTDHVGRVTTYPV
ncbi:MAG: hypothetical protein ACKOYM_00990 [Actinomycetes bacterium]